MLSYQLFELPLPSGATGGAATAVNEDGTAVGYAYMSGVSPVVWDASGPKVISPDGLASGVNGKGVVAGLLHFSYPHRAFFYDGTTLHDIAGTIGEDESSASDINDTGLLVGSAGGIATKRPFLYDTQSGTHTFLSPLPGHAMAHGSAINDSGHAVGISSDANWSDDRIFLWDGGQLVDAGSATWATGLNENDTVVGSKAFDEAKTWTAYRLPAGGTFENLGHTPVAGYGGSHGNGINDQGVVVGHSFPAYWQNQTPPFRGFVHIPSGPDAGWHDLPDVIDNADGWVIESATDVNNDGVIVGYGRYQGQTRAFRLVPDEAPNLFELLSDRFALQFIKLFGGVAAGGGGIGILPNGKPIPIDPPGWRALSRAEKDLILGFALRQSAALLGEAENRRLVDEAGLAVVQASVTRLESRI